MEKKFRRLNRRELVDVIYQLKKNEQHLQEQIASLQADLEDKRLRISAAGSIAEATADITQIFATAQATADLYLQEIACLKAETEAECAAMIAQAQQKAQQILAEANGCGEGVENA